jgi:hypothetical protein
MIFLPVVEPLSPLTSENKEEGEEEEVVFKLLWMMSYPGLQDEYASFVLSDIDKEDIYGGPSNGDKLREDLKQVLLGKSSSYFLVFLLRAPTLISSPSSLPVSSFVLSFPSSSF